MIYLLLPAYNEEHALRPLVEKIDRAMREQAPPAPGSPRGKILPLHMNVKGS